MAKLRKILSLCKQWVLEKAQVVHGMTAPKSSKKTEPTDGKCPFKNPGETMLKEAVLLHLAPLKTSHPENLMVLLTLSFLNEVSDELVSRNGWGLSGEKLNSVSADWAAHAPETGCFAYRKLMTSDGLDLELSLSLDCGVSPPVTSIESLKEKRPWEITVRVYFEDRPLISALSWSADAPWDAPKVAVHVAGLVAREIER